MMRPRHFIPLIPIIVMMSVACGDLLSSFSSDEESPTPTTTAPDGSANATDGNGTVPGEDTGTSNSTGDAGSSDTGAVDTGAPNLFIDPNNCGQLGKVCKAKGCNGGVCDLVVFTTKAAFDGNFGGAPGLAGADGKCNAAATNAGLGPRMFKAWLSDDATHAAARLANSAGPYRRLDGTLAFMSVKTLITDGHPLVALDLNEDGAQFVPTGQLTFTGTDPQGMKTTFTCASWMDNTGNTTPGATYGATTSIGSQWTMLNASHCAGAAHLYCLEQP